MAGAKAKDHKDQKPKLPRYYTAAEVAEHNAEEDLWVSFLGKVRKNDVETRPGALRLSSLCRGLEHAAGARGGLALRLLTACVLHRS